VSTRLQRRRDKGSPATLSDTEFGRLLGGADRSISILSFPEHFLPGEDRDRVIAAATASPAESGFRAIAKSSQLHSFDLLGSGPTTPSYILESGESEGAFGHRYQNAPGLDQESAQIERMTALMRSAQSFLDTRDTRGSNAPDATDTPVIEVPQSYRPIDWHVDFKSGYRWDPGIWWLDTIVAPEPGVDIKVPWELSRSHHLVAIALNGVADGRESDAATEVGLQILDWIAANPVRFGVNWRSAMDVSIRAANWIWALSILGSEAFPTPLTWLIAKSLYQHGQFVESHLDYTRAGTNNHYLADIVGLLHISAALPEVPESDAWAALCIQELVSEMGREVLVDGSNYEGSTGYHRLVAEMFHHGTTTALRMPVQRRTQFSQAKSLRRRAPAVEPATWGFDPGDPEVFPDWYYERLSLMAGLTSDLTKPNGLVPQFGDQDSGRFLKFDWPLAGTDSVPVEEHRDHGHLLATSGGLFKDHADVPEPYSVERAAGGTQESPDRLAQEQSGSGIERLVWDDGSSDWRSNGGYYVARSGHFWVCLRCDSVRIDTPMGHRHNDQLSFELNVGGLDFLVDPGSGVYTPNPELRNRMRSTASHNTASVDGSEHRSYGNGIDDMFLTGGNSHAEVDSIGPGTFSAVHGWSGNVHRRSFEIQSSRLVITDQIETDGSWSLNYIVPPEVTVNVEQSSRRIILSRDSISLAMIISDGNATITRASVPYAPAYGRIESATRLTIKPMDDNSVTTIELVT